jgi:hypothetical protein
MTVGGPPRPFIPRRPTSGVPAWLAIVDAEDRIQGWARCKAGAQERRAAVVVASQKWPSKDAMSATLSKVDPSPPNDYWHSTESRRRFTVTSTKTSRELPSTSQSRPCKRSWGILRIIVLYACAFLLAQVSMFRAKQRQLPASSYDLKSREASSCSPQLKN